MAALRTFKPAKLSRWRLFSSCLILLALVTSVIDVRPTWAAPVVPTTSQIENMPVFAQQHYLSCEYAATRAAVARWGIQISEAEFIKAIPTNANPHLGFRGNIDSAWGGTTNYGIYPEPIARYLETRGFNTKLLWAGIDSIKEEVSLGRPVVAWISGGLTYANPFTAQSEDKSFLLMPFEHTVTIYSYNEGGIYVADPGFGTYNYYSWSEFSRSWSYLGNMAISIWPTTQPSVSVERPGIAPEFYRYWLREAGLQLTGLPLASAYQVKGKIIQYFERARLEYDLGQSPDQKIQRGLIGLELTQSRQGEKLFQALSEAEKGQLTAEEQTSLFVDTGFVLAPVFKDFWWQRGSVAIFGYPISRPFYEGGLLVQYFERARMELHPAASDSTLPAIILLGLLGNERLAKSVSVNNF